MGATVAQLPAAALGAARRDRQDGTRRGCDGHTPRVSALAYHPAEWEARVINFLDHALPAAVSNETHGGSCISPVVSLDEGRERMISRWYQRALGYALANDGRPPADPAGRPLATTNWGHYRPSQRGQSGLTSPDAAATRTTANGPTGGMAASTSTEATSG